MARGIKLKAIFGDGTIERIVTQKSFSHCWRITGIVRGGVTREIYGWARNEQAARQAAAIYTRHQQRQRWRDVKCEVVEAERT